MLRGDRIWLDTAPLAEALAGALGEPVGSLAFYVGTEGAYQKLTVRVGTRDGRISAYAKIAGERLARESLERERVTLARLARVGELRDKVPEILGWVSWGELRGLIVSSGPTRRGPRRLTAQHVEFLRCLWGATRVEIAFRESSMWARMTAMIDGLLPHMPAPWPDRYSRALDRLDCQIGRTTLPLGLAHRDFAPWNTTCDARGLFVFDWEAAQDEVTPLYDIFHFDAIQAAQRRKRGVVPSRAGAAGGLVGDVIGFAPDVALAALYGAYLIDMSLFYTEARVLAPDAGEDGVWQWLGFELDAWTEGRHDVA
jgi:hypothetical protein